LFVFWYHSPNVLDTPHICNISWLRVKTSFQRFSVTKDVFTCLKMLLAVSNPNRNIGVSKLCQWRYWQLLADWLHPTRVRSHWSSRPSCASFSICASNIAPISGSDLRNMIGTSSSRLWKYKVNFTFYHFALGNHLNYKIPIPAHFKTLWKLRSINTPSGWLAREAVEYIYSAQTVSDKLP
jgi:hypothetical protein